MPPVRTSIEKMAAAIGALNVAAIPAGRTRRSPALRTLFGVSLVH